MKSILFTVMLLGSAGLGYSACKVESIESDMADDLLDVYLSNCSVELNGFQHNIVKVRLIHILDERKTRHLLQLATTALIAQSTVVVKFTEGAIYYHQGTNDITLRDFTKFKILRE